MKSAYVADDLRAILAPSTFEEFAEHSWPHSVTVAHGPLERLPGLSGLASLAPELFQTYRRDVRLKFPGPQGTHLDVAVPPSQAGSLYSTGMTALFYGLQDHVPALSDYCHAMNGVLGLHPNSCGVAAHLSRVGRGFPMHFDGYEVLTLQLRGRKRWWVGATPVVPGASVGHVFGTPVAPELLRYWPEGNKLDASFQPSLDQIDLVPGSVLFVPRGHIHKTEALDDEESFSISFGWKLQNWASVIAERVRERLIRREHWRAPAAGGFSAPDRASSQRAREHLAAHLPRWIEDVGAFTPDDVCGRTVVRPNDVDQAIALLSSKRGLSAAAGPLIVCQWHLHGADPRDFHLLIEDGRVRVQPGTHASPHVTGITKVPDFLALVATPQIATELVLDGRLTFQPLDLPLLSRLAATITEALEPS